MCDLSLVCPSLLDSYEADISPENQSTAVDTTVYTMKGTGVTLLF